MFSIDFRFLKMIARGRHRCIRLHRTVILFRMLLVAPSCRLLVVDQVAYLSLSFVDVQEIDMASIRIILLLACKSH